MIYIMERPYDDFSLDLCGDSLRSYLNREAGPGDPFRSIDTVFSSLCSAGYRSTGTRLRTVVSLGLPGRDSYLEINIPHADPIFWSDAVNPSRPLQWCIFPANMSLLFLRDWQVALQLKLVNFEV